MGLGGALQQLGNMYLQRRWQQQDQQKQLDQQKANREAEFAEWQKKQEFLARLGAPQERVRQVYDEQLKNAQTVREQWNPETRSWQETARDMVPPKDKQPQVVTGWKGSQQVTGIVDPDKPESFRELFTGAPPKSQIVGGSGHAKAPAGYRYTDDGDLEAIPGGPADFRQQQADAKQQAAEAKAGQLSSSDKKNVASLRQSLGALDAIEAQLNTAEEAWKPLKGSMSAGGFGQGMIPTESGKRFDAAVRQLGPLMRQLTRVPGEGAMSDYETKLLERSTLSRGDYESTTEEKLKNLRQLVDETRKSRLSALDTYGLDANGEPKNKAEPSTEKSGAQGTSRSNPIQIQSEADADKLPPGTWIILNGRVGQT